MQTVIPVAVVLVGIAVGTYFQGVESERWEKRNDTELLITMTSRLKNTPLEVGEWRGEVINVTKEMEQQYERAHVSGHIDIKYEHTRTGKIVQISLVCAPSREIGIHTPNKCYVGAGYKMKSKYTQKNVSWDGGVAEVTAAAFYKETDAGMDNQQLVWCWGSEGKEGKGEWIAQGGVYLGRIKLAFSPAWYKLYVTTVIPNNVRVTDVKENIDFMREFMPALNAVLFPPEKPDEDSVEQI